MKVKIREWGIGNYSLFGSPGHHYPRIRGHENEKVHLLARSKGAYGILNPIGVQDSIPCSGQKMDLVFDVRPSGTVFPHHRVKVRPGERKRVPRFPGSWTLKSQDRLRPRGQPSRPETVLALEESPRSREWGIGNYSLFGSPGRTLSRNGGHENEKVHLLARSKGAYGILNPIGVQDSIPPGRARWTSFRCPAFRDSLPHHRVKVRPGERRGSPDSLDLGPSRAKTVSGREVSPRGRRRSAS